MADSFRKRPFMRGRKNSSDRVFKTFSHHKIRQAVRQELHHSDYEEIQCPLKYWEEMVSWSSCKDWRTYYGPLYFIDDREHWETVYPWRRYYSEDKRREMDQMDRLWKRREIYQVFCK
jgi:hypothetical protein